MTGLRRRPIRSRSRAPGERVSLAAIRYVAECRHELIGGSVKNFMWAVGYLVVKGERRTPGVLLPTLEEYTGDDLRTVQRARDVLRSPEVGLLNVYAAGAKRVVYELAKFEVQGELFGLRTPGQDDKLSRSVPGHHDKLSRSITSDCRDTPSITSDCRDAARPIYISTLGEEEEEEEPRKPRTLVERVEEAQTYLDQFADEFSRHQGGAIYTSDESALKTTLELLEHRPLSRLLKLARLMLTTTQDDDPDSDRTFIATAPNKGIHLLRHKINYLDQELARIETSRPAPRAEPRARATVGRTPAPASGHVPTPPGKYAHTVVGGNRHG